MAGSHQVKTCWLAGNDPHKPSLASFETPRFLPNTPDFVPYRTGKKTHERRAVFWTQESRPGWRRHWKSAKVDQASYTSICESPLEKMDMFPLVKSIPFKPHQGKPIFFSSANGTHLGARSACWVAVCRCLASKARGGHMGVDQKVLYMGIRETPKQMLCPTRKNYPCSFSGFFSREVRIRDPFFCSLV